MSEYINIERALELPFGHIDRMKKRKMNRIEKALFKILKAYPWLIDVADAGWDTLEAEGVYLKAAIDVHYEKQKSQQKEGSLRSERSKS